MLLGISLAALVFDYNLGLVVVLSAAALLLVHTQTAGGGAWPRILAYAAGAVLAVHAAETMFWGFPDEDIVVASFAAVAAFLFAASAGLPWAGRVLGMSAAALMLLRGTVEMRLVELLIPVTSSSAWDVTRILAFFVGPIVVVGWTLVAARHLTPRKANDS